MTVAREAVPAALSGEAVLEVRNLTVRLPSPSGYLTVVDNASYTIRAGQVFGIAGESGSGKTMSMLAIMGLLPNGAVVSGHALYQGHDLLALSKGALRRFRGKEIAMVFQDPTTSLHPMLTIGRQLTDHMRYHLRLSKAAAIERAVELLNEVRIPDPHGALSSFPHHFSGGMRQRIAIAIALACHPRLLIADEPTTALDVTVQAGILRLLDRLRTQNNVSVILITHNLGVLSAIADTVNVFYAGRVVESGTTAQVLGRSEHPYTKGLLDALPRQTASGVMELVPIRGTAPVPQFRPPGCAFHPRCAYAVSACATDVPPLADIGGGRLLACPPRPFRKTG